MLKSDNLTGDDEGEAGGEMMSGIMILNSDQTAHHLRSRQKYRENRVLCTGIKIPELTIQ